MSDIVIAGNTYTQVPSIIVPKSGGGNATFYENDNLSFLGKGAELVNDNVYSKTFDLYNSDFHGWTPSTTAKVCVASVTKSKELTLTGMSDNEYMLVWECDFTPVYNGSETNQALPLFSKAYLVQCFCKRPSSYVNITNNNFNATVCVSQYTSTFMRYYGSTAGTVTYTWSASYGFYFGLTASTFVDATLENVVVNLKTPTFTARCSTTYFSTANAGKIDEDDSTGSIKAKLYRVKRNGFLRGVYEQTVNMING